MMSVIKSAIYLVVLALAAPWLYDRYIAFSFILANRPGKLQVENHFKSHEIKFSGQIRNCEDVILQESLGVAFLSCDPGRDRWNTVMGTFQPPATKPSISNNGALYIYDYTDAGSSALRKLTLTSKIAQDFHPLGIAFDASTSTLHVINHSRAFGSVIELFQVSIRDATATHVKTFKHPLLHAPNAIHLLGDGKMYVTNDHYVRAAVSPVLSQIETFSGVPGGSVVFVDIHNPETAKVVARVPFANGIVEVNSSTVAVASSSKSGIYLYTTLPNRDLKFEKLVRMPAGADNLSVDGKGRVLVAGHPFAPQLMKVAKGRANCDESGDEEERKACGCDAPSWVGEWSEEEGVRTLLRSSGKDGVCSASTAVRDVGRGVGIVSMLYGRGIVVFKE